MTLSYRTRRTLSNLASVLLILVLVAVIVWMVWIVWLDRFVVYSRDGAELRFDSYAENRPGEVAVPPESQPNVSIFYNDGSGEQVATTELTQLVGYYADSDALQTDFAAVRSQVEQLPAGTAVMVDVKDIYGYFFYSSGVGPAATAMDTAAMDDLITYMNGSGLYTIARVPAFRDYYFGLNETQNGLFRPDGFALWNDNSADRLTYWLDPTQEGTITYLTQIVNELKRLGFDEVVFTEFRFPNTTELQFSGDRTAAITEAADTLATICATDSFCVSFETANASFVLPQGERCRMYLTGIAAADARSTAEATGLADPAIRVVFLTEQGDTRYDEFGVLRPVSLIRYETTE